MIIYMNLSQNLKLLSHAKDEYTLDQSNLMKYSAYIKERNDFYSDKELIIILSEKNELTKDQR